MPLSLFDSIRSQKMRRYFTVFLAICAGFYAMIYMPVYYLLSSNVIWVDSPLLLLWMELISPLMNYTLYWGSFAFVIYHAFRFGFASVRFSVFMYALFTAIRNFSGIFSYMSVMGAIRWSEFVLNDLFGMIFSTLMDWLQMGVLLLTLFLIWKREIKKDPSLYKTEESARRYMPIGKGLDFSNSALLTALIISVVPAVIRVLERLYYDLDLILNLGMKVEGAGEVIVMISYYVTDLLTIPLGCVAISLVLNLFCKLETRAVEAAEKKQDEEA